MFSELISAKQVKKILKVSLPYVYRLADQGRIPCVRIPCPGEGTERPRTLVRFKLKDVLNFVEKHYQG